MESASLNLAEHLRRQFAYDAWANREVLIVLRRNGGEDVRPVQLLSHILAAERLWMDRLEGKNQSVKVWPESDVSQCDGQIEDLGRLWPPYLSGVADFSEAISYKNSKGEPWTSTIVDVLTHVVMHSAYHRGQIASHMRENGQTPAYTDFIHGVRQGLVK
jgi:uncharacterized damage-inducible protein DinB